MNNAGMIARAFHIANSERIALWTAPNGTPMVGFKSYGSPTRVFGWHVTPIRSLATEPQP